MSVGGALLAGAALVVGVGGLLFATSFVAYVFVAGDPGPISVGVERTDERTALLVPDCGEPGAAPVEVLLTNLDDLGPDSVEPARLSAADPDLEVRRAADFSGWRVTSTGLPRVDTLVEPTESDSWSVWSGVLPSDPPEGFSVTVLSDEPEGVETVVLPDVAAVVRVACASR